MVSKTELKKQLKDLGIKVEGNYVRKSDIETALVSADSVKFDWHNKTELKKQLKKLGIKVEGNYIRKSDVEKILG